MKGCGRVEFMRLYRRLLVALGVFGGLAVLAIALGALWLNTYVHSAAFKAEIEDRISQTIGGRVQIQSIDFDILHGVKLQSLVMQIDSGHSGGQGELQVSVDSVDCACSWLPLLHRQLKLTGLTLTNPRLVLTRQAPSPPPPLPAPGQANSAPAEAGGGGVPFQFTLDRAHVAGGSLSVLDATGSSMVALEGVTVDADTSGYADRSEVTGTLAIADIVLPSNVHITGFKSPVSYRAGQLLAQPFAASVFGGNLAGDYTLGGVGADSSLLTLNAKGVDMVQMNNALRSGTSAKLTGLLDVQSKWRGVETGVAVGEGEAQLTNGRLEGVRILHDLAKVLRVKELDTPSITQAKTHFVVANRRTQFTGLQIDSVGFQMTGSGVIAFDGGLDADMVLALSRGSMGKLPKEASIFFIQQPDGSGSIAYHLSGTVANPQTDLVTRLFIQNMQLQNAVKKTLDKFF
jgi:hypothetical protein